MESKSNHNQLSDSKFIDQFANGSLNPEIFNHEAHLRLAWLYIYRLGIKQAEQDIQDQLQSFVETVGAKDKYHKTLTIVATRIVNHFMQKSKSENFTDFINEFPQLKSEFKELVNTHYSFNIFTSELAKREFLKPDLLAFE
ncbi:hypothetical protein [uncultured Psychroserpens sp.]|uniref:hypothetical protein n=1 Tax=uncultured Psychroserpens sp. TaxID=255436 RepID=UPI0026095313|nr:hypothetical protein [uncultured Psychroserpens sp.]